MLIDSKNYSFRDYCGLDIETTGLSPVEDEIVVITIHSDETYIWKSWEHPKEFFVELLTELSKVKVVLHNAKFDLGFLYQKYGVLLTNVTDTFIHSKVINNGKLQFSNSLTNCLETYLGIKDEAHEDKRVIRNSFKIGILTLAQAEYAAADVVHLGNLGRKLEELSTMYSKVIALEHKLLPVIVRMEAKGVRIDTDKLREFITLWGAKKNEYLQKLDWEVDKLYSKHGAVKPLFGNVNYGSPEQILGLFKMFDQPIPNDGDKDTSGEDVLLQYINERPSSDMRGLIEALLKFREYNKLVSTYGQPLLDKVVDEYLHGEFKPLGTLTGRLSSANPNLQNIPSDGDGGEIRTCFIADEGDELITSDMQAAEVRLAADYSKDKLLLKSVLDGEDMHSKLASVSFSIIFGEPFTVSKSTVAVRVKGGEVIPNELRNIHKSATFCKFYKGGPKRIYGVLSKYINMFHKKGGMKIAKKVSDALDEEMKGLSHYLLEVISEANRKGCLVGKLGRIRYFGKNVYGEAANFKIQNANGEAIKVAMINIDKYLTETNTGRIVLSVHDELVCSVRKDRAQQAAVEIQRIMAESLSYFMDEVPGEASAKISKHWEK
jgi:DNA polymerase I